jgi:hypothetical protein
MAMFTRKSACMVIVLALAGSPAAAQLATGGATSGQTQPTEPPVLGATPAAPAPLTVVFRGLQTGDALRLGPADGEPAEQAVADDGSATVELAPGVRYELRWGSPGSEERLRFYMPRPADGAAPLAPVEVALRRGARGLPSSTWNSYAWAPGEAEKVTPPRPPAPAPVPRPEREAPRVREPEPTRPVVPDLSGLATKEELGVLEQELRREAQLNRLLAVLSLGLGVFALAAGLGFYAAAWRPHRAAAAEALERSLPDALRAQSQEVAAVGRRLDASLQQWEHDRETLRRGQELLAAHISPASRDPVREELDRLRRENDDLRRQLAGRRG